MVRTIASFALFISTSAFAQSADVAADIPMEWLKSNTPYGFDITPEGHIWVNLNPVGRESDYSFLAEDLMKRNEFGASGWLRGYHKKNTKVSYRQTKAQYWFDCKKRTYKRINFFAYSVEGELVESSQQETIFQPAVPGSIAEEWFAITCPRS